MDPALIPPTGPGRQLAWLMNLEAEPSAEEIGDHLEPTAAGEVHVHWPGQAAGNPGLGSGLLAFGTMVRELPGAVTRSEDDLVCLELEQGCCGPVRGGLGRLRGQWQDRAVRPAGPPRRGGR